jgi:hypothetical protein
MRDLQQRAARTALEMATLDQTTGGAMATDHAVSQMMKGKRGVAKVEQPELVAV